MKTSKNKILLALFLAIIVILLGIKTVMADMSICSFISLLSNLKVISESRALTANSLYQCVPAPVVLNNACYNSCMSESDGTVALCSKYCGTQSGGNITPIVNNNFVTSGVTGSGLKIVPPTTGIYLGSYNWGGRGIADFEAAVGKKVAIIGGVCSAQEDKLPTFNSSCWNSWYAKGYVGITGYEGADKNSNNTAVVPNIAIGRYTPEQVISGLADNLLKQIAGDIKTFNKPIFWQYQREPSIQPAPGFDGGGYGPNGDKYSNQVTDKYGAYGCTDTGNSLCLDGPERYRDAAKHIHDIVESVCKDCVTWVQGASVARKSGEYKKYYIGDNYVDWHALDVYPYYDQNIGALIPFNSEIKPDWAEALALSNKPIMFVEFGVWKTDQTGEGCKTCQQNIISRANWFNDFFSKVKSSHNQLKAIVYWQTNDSFITSLLPTDADSQVWKTEISNNPNYWLSTVLTN
jgi:hypothetical protein